MPALPAGTCLVDIAAGQYFQRRRGEATAPWSRGDRIIIGDCPASRPILSGFRSDADRRPPGDTRRALRLAAAAIGLGTGCGGVGTPIFNCYAAGARAYVTLSLSLTHRPRAHRAAVYASGVPPSPLTLGVGIAFVQVRSVDGEARSCPSPSTRAGPGSWITPYPLPRWIRRSSGRPPSCRSRSGRHAGPIGFDISNGLPRHDRAFETAR